MQSQMVHIHKIQISNVQIQYVESKIWLQVSAPETILGLEIGFGHRLIAASVTPTITDSDSALLGCRLLPGKNYVFWLRVWKNAWMTPPSHTARPLPPQSEQFLGGANSCHRCLYRPENCLVPQSDMIFDFFSKNAWYDDTDIKTLSLICCMCLVFFPWIPNIGNIKTNFWCYVI